MNQVERISEMEKILQEAKPVLSELRAALETYKSIEGSIKELESYYGSEVWWEDLKTDEAGLLPDDLKRGVLSQDEVYDLLEEQTDLIHEMREICDIGILDAE